MADQESWFAGLLGRILSAGVEVPMTSGLNFTGRLTAVRNQATNVTDVSLPDAAVDPAALAVAASSVSVPFLISIAFAAATTGTADDVTIYAANAPFAFRIVRTFVVVTTAVAASNARLRSATAGGGSALSAIFATDVATEEPIRTSPLSAYPTVIAGGSLYLRRGDRAIAGRVAILCERI